jgi:hypothetical protein
VVVTVRAAGSAEAISAIFTSTFGWERNRGRSENATSPRLSWAVATW